MKFIHLPTFLAASLALACAGVCSVAGAAAADAAAPGATASEPSEAARAMIEALDLRAAEQPMSANPRWRPRRVVVTMPAAINGIVPDLEARLRAVAGDVELVIDKSGNLSPGAETLAGADALIGLCTPDTLAAADPALLWLHNYTAGMDRCTGLSDSQRDRVVFSNNKRLYGPGIAEHSIAMLMALTRGIPGWLELQGEGKWDRGTARNLAFGELQGKTLLVVGLGGIGTEVARRAHGLGMRVTATRNSSRSGPPFVAYVGLSDELHKLAAQAHVIVNALPLTKSTTGLFDRAFFEATRPGAIFISVGRGKSTVTADLVAALENGQLYGAGLDMTDPEPLPEDSPLWQMDNVIITPHISAAGAGSMRRAAILAEENLRRYVAGEPLLNLVDIRAGY